MAGEIIRKTFKYRLYPTSNQVEKLEGTLALCCELYNGALQERRDAWRINRKSINFAHQSAQLPGIKEIRPELNDVYGQVLQDTLHRVDKTFKAFFGRIKKGEKPGYPRFRPRSRYDSFTYPQHEHGFRINANKFQLSKIGNVRIKLHRPLEGKIKTLTVKREAGRWYVCFSAVLRYFEETLLHQNISIKLFSACTIRRTMACPYLLSTRLKWSSSSLTVRFVVTTIWCLWT